MAVPLVLRVPDPGEVRGAVVRVARHHALHPVPELRPGPLELVVPVSPMIRPLQYEIVMCLVLHLLADPLFLIFNVLVRS